MTDNPLTPAFDAITARMAADKARIAKLEAENERLKRNWQTEADARVEDITRAEQAEAERDEAMATMYHERGDKEQAEAELAALKGRRCEDCGWEHCATEDYSMSYEEDTSLVDMEDNFYCARWKARP